MKKTLAAFLCLSLAILSACGTAHEPSSVTAPAHSSLAAVEDITIVYNDSGYPEAPVQADADMLAMDTVMHFRVYARTREEAESTLRASFDEIARLDRLMSTNRRDSDLARLNRIGHAVFSKDSAYLLRRSLEINEVTGGYFNVAVYPLVKAWGFTTAEPHVPSEQEIQALLPLTHLEQVHFDRERREVRFAHNGMGLDFGGIAKGYASQRLMEIFSRHSTVSGLVSLGGNTQLYGGKPDGSPFRVGVQDPAAADRYIGIIRTKDRALITSGIYQRFFEANGRTYHHIIDPATGAPADNSLASATVICNDGTTADALATALMIMGKEQAIAFWRQHSDLFEMVLIEKNRNVSITAGLEDCYIPKDDVLPEVIRREA